MDKPLTGMCGMLSLKQMSEQSGRPRVVIDPNPRKERERLDKDGNIIDPRTKEIIKKAEDNK